MTPASHWPPTPRSAWDRPVRGQAGSAQVLLRVSWSSTSPAANASVLPGDIVAPSGDTARPLPGVVLSPYPAVIDPPLGSRAMSPLPSGRALPLEGVPVMLLPGVSGAPLPAGAPSALRGLTG